MGAWLEMLSRPSKGADPVRDKALPSSCNCHNVHLPSCVLRRLSGHAQAEALACKTDQIDCRMG